MRELDGEGAIVRWARPIPCSGRSIEIMLGKRKHAQQETCDDHAEIGVRDAGEAHLEAKCERDVERD